jgi:predicted nucleotidyltransferase
MKIVQDYKDLLVLLEAHCVDYLLIGGYAVGLYGYARATVDIDIWVRRTTDNAHKIERVLAEFGFPLNNINVEDFTDENAIFQMGLPPNRLDILTSISGVEFDIAYSRKNRVLLDGIEINLISLADLKANKLASARHKDLNDLHELNKNTSE